MFEIHFHLNNMRDRLQQFDELYKPIFGHTALMVESVVISGNELGEGYLESLHGGEHVNHLNSKELGARTLLCSLHATWYHHVGGSFSIFFINILHHQFALWHVV